MDGNQSVDMQLCFDPIVLIDRYNRRTSQLRDKPNCQTMLHVPLYVLCLHGVCRIYAASHSCRCLGPSNHAACASVRPLHDVCHICCFSCHCLGPSNG